MRVRGLLFPALALGTFLILASASARWMAPTFDEHYHELAGLAVGREADYRFGPNHPPLIRVLAALPNILDRRVVLPSGSPAYREGEQLSAAKELLARNDYWVMLQRSRHVVILLTATLGLLLWVWSRRLFGAAAAAAVLFLFVLEPNLMAHGSLFTTDLGVTLLFALTAWCLREVWLRLTPASIAGLAVSFSLAQVSKFSAIVLWPAIALVLLLRALGAAPWDLALGRRHRSLARRGGKAAVAATLLLVLSGTFLLVVWGVYGFRYAMAPRPGLTVDLAEDPEFAASDREMGATLRSIRILPEAYVRGAAQILTWPRRTYYLAGKLRDQPVWWFYPVALLVKTPSAVLVLFALGAWFAVRCPAARPPGWQALAIPPAALFAAGIASGQATGIRHLLPGFPFLLLVAGLAVAKLRASRAGRVALVLLALVSVTEFTLAFPDTLAAFNLPSGGPSHGDAWLADTNMDWGQGVKALREWADERGLATINVACHSHFFQAYGRGARILRVYTRQSPMQMPVLPGYVAVSASIVTGAADGRRCAEFYAPFRKMTPAAVIGNSIKVYYVERPWWSPGDDWITGGPGERP